LNVLVIEFCPWHTCSGSWGSCKISRPIEDNLCRQSKEVSIWRQLSTEWCWRSS